jgi:hypothetical protein
MASCDVVLPETVRLNLSDGRFVVVVKELNAGEYYDLISAQAARKPFAKVLAYVLSWSLVGLDGQPLSYSVQLSEDERRDTVRSLRKARVLELIAAIDRHEAAQDAASAEKKTERADESGSSAPSPSVAS